MSGKKIKIALCISGEPRNDIDAFPYIYNTFLNSSQYEVDVYIHSLKSPLSLSLYQPKKCLIETNIENKLINKVNSKLNKDVKILGQNPTSVPLMYYSMYKCFSLIKEKYDVYIRLRFDSFFNISDNYFKIVQSILDNEFDIFIPKSEKEHEHWFSNFKIQGYSDRFAIGNHKAMSCYFNTYLNIENIFNQTKIFNTHFLLFSQLSSSKIKVYNPIFQDMLLRHSNKIIFQSLDEFYI